MHKQNTFATNKWITRNICNVTIIRKRQTFTFQTTNKRPMFATVKHMTHTKITCASVGLWNAKNRKECNYHCIECKTNVNNSLLPNLPSKDQSLTNLNKLYSNPNSTYSNQINSNSLNICKNCTVPISSIPPNQFHSFAKPPLFLTPKLLCLNPLR